jgi:hypothetical protein
MPAVRRFSKSVFFAAEPTELGFVALSERFFCSSPAATKRQAPTPSCRSVAKNVSLTPDKPGASLAESDSRPPRFHIWHGVCIFASCKFV